MTEKYTLQTKEAPDGSGDMIIELPQTLLDTVGWKEGDILDYNIVNGKLVVQKVDEKN